VSRVTGKYQESIVGGERVRAFLPDPLPPRKPPLEVDGPLAESHAAAVAALDRLNIVAATVPSAGWFLYGFVRKEAVISSQIEGTQATLGDVVEFETTRQSDRLEDVEEVCNYVAALKFARAEVARPKGLPLCARLLCEAHRKLMAGVRGQHQHPGSIRTSQNWIGGTRPGNARFVPPPPEAVPKALAALDQWIHGSDPLPPLIRAGLAHVQFETIHPFLDGNGRIGRLLITLLVEHWGLLNSPLLYLSLAFKQRREEYYNRLSGVRTDGNWEGWTQFFLECVRSSADDGVRAAGRIFAKVEADRRAVTNHAAATVPAIRLFEALSDHPMVTLPVICDLLDVTKPTASKAIDALRQAGVLHETTGKRRDRIYAYRDYLAVLEENTGIETESASTDSAARPRTKRKRSTTR
jgi:Fic family protein